MTCLSKQKFKVSNFDLTITNLIKIVKKIETIFRKFIKNGMFISYKIKEKNAFSLSVISSLRIILTRSPQIRIMFYYKKLIVARPLLFSEINM